MVGSTSRLRWRPHLRLAATQPCTSSCTCVWLAVREEGSHSGGHMCPRRLSTTILSRIFCPNHCATTGNQNADEGATISRKYSWHHPDDHGKATLSIGHYFCGGIPQTHPYASVPRYPSQNALLRQGSPSYKACIL